MAVREVTGMWMRGHFNISQNPSCTLAASGLATKVPRVSDACAVPQRLPSPSMSSYTDAGNHAVYLFALVYSCPLIMKYVCVHLICDAFWVRSVVMKTTIFLHLCACAASPVRAYSPTVGFGLRCLLLCSLFVLTSTEAETWTCSTAGVTKKDVTHILKWVSTHFLGDVRLWPGACGQGAMPGGEVGWTRLHPLRSVDRYI